MSVLGVLSGTTLNFTLEIHASPALDIRIPAEIPSAFARTSCLYAFVVPIPSALEKQTP